MSNYWNKLSPLHGTVTKRQSHATGGIAFKAGSGRAKSVKEKEKKNNRKRGKFESPDYSKRVSKETYEEAKKDVGDIKGKAHHLKAHKKEGEKRLKELRKKQNWTFVPEKVLKEVYPQRDKGWGGKHSRKIEHNAKGGRVGLKDGKSIAAKTLVAGFVGKAKDWPGAKAVKKLNKKGKTRK